MVPDHSRTHQLEIRAAVATTGAIALLVPFGVVAAAVAGRVDGLHDFDVRVTDALHSFASTHPGWVTAMKAWSLIFDPWTWRAGALLLVIWLVRRRARPLACWVAATMIAGGVLGALLKVLFGRHRPDLVDAVAHAAGYSFPSGHALNSSLGAAVFLLVLLPVAHHLRGGRAALWTAAIVIPLVTGFARVLLGVHWTTDVVGGWLLGAAVPALTAWAYLIWERGRPVHPHVASEGLEPELTVNEGEA